MPTKASLTWPFFCYITLLITNYSSPWRPEAWNNLLLLGFSHKLWSSFLWLSQWWPLAIVNRQALWNTAQSPDVWWPWSPQNIKQNHSVITTPHPLRGARRVWLCCSGQSERESSSIRTTGSQTWTRDAGLIYKKTQVVNLSRELIQGTTERIK